VTDVPQPNDRLATLDARRQLKMARNAHAYVRGSTEAFYKWIQSDKRIALPDGPPVWICGDCHIGNLGPIGHPAGDAVVEIRDLDQTVIGNPAYDVVRLALSLAMAARSSDLPGVTTAHLTEHLIAGYEQAFDGDAPPEHIGELPDPIDMVMKRAVRRTWEQLSDESLDRAQRTIPIGRTFWPLDDEERAALKAFVDDERLRKLVQALSSRPDDAKIRFLDAAFWVKGCSSLGLWRAALLVGIEHRSAKGKKRQGVALVDVKQAVEAIPPWAKAADHAHLAPADRVLTGAIRLAPALGGRMMSASLLGRSVYVRELLPQDLKVELDQITPEQGRSVAHYFGMVLGRAHGRQLDPAARQRWRTEMVSHHTKDLDAPSWLWRAVVDLVGVHERAYLEHCRRYALEASRADIAAEDAA
jgi:uncharacterized protein (DUF2252 family)